MIGVKKAKYISGYSVKFTFTDGKVETLNLEPYLTGPIFEEIKNLKQFTKFKVDPELNTICWENGADFAPKFLHELASTT